MDKRSGFALVPIFLIVFLACAVQAIAPVSPPESRFVWEPEGHFELIRTDPEGNELWNRTPRLAVYTDRISSLAQTDDCGVIITSVSREDRNYYNSKLIKLDSNGSEQWNRSSGGKYEDIFSSVRQTGDGGYIIAGMTESYYWNFKQD